MSSTFSTHPDGNLISEGSERRFIAVIISHIDGRNRGRHPLPQSSDDGTLAANVFWKNLPDLGAIQKMKGMTQRSQKLQKNFIGRFYGSVGSAAIMDSKTEIFVFHPDSR